MVHEREPGVVRLVPDYGVAFPGSLDRRVDNSTIYRQPRGEKPSKKRADGDLTMRPDEPRMILSLRRQCEDLIPLRAEPSLESLPGRR